MSRIEDLERRLGKDPSSKIFAQLAEEYRKAGRLEDAIQTCRDGLEIHPNYFSARVALGRALLETDALNDARLELEAVLAQVPDNILANKFLGKTYEQLGRLEDAVAKYRIAQMLAPEDAGLADRVQAIEAQLDGVLAGNEPGSPRDVPPPPAVHDPTGIELPELPELDGAEPPVIQEPTLVVDEFPADVLPMIQGPVGVPRPEGEIFETPTTDVAYSSGGALEREQVFEFGESPGDQASAPSSSVQSSDEGMVPAMTSEPEPVFEFGGSLENQAQDLPPLTRSSGEEVPPSIMVEPEQVFEFGGSLENEAQALPPLTQSSDEEKPPPIKVEPEQVFEFDESLENEAQVLPPLAQSPDEGMSRELERETEQVFEFDDVPRAESRQASTSGGEKGPDLGDGALLADDTSAMHDRLEQGFLTGEAGGSTGQTPSPAAPPMAVPESFEMGETPVVETPTAGHEERGITQPMNVAGDAPLESAPPEFQAQEIPAEPEEPVPQPGMTTATLAELYASQGHIEEALGVYRELVASHPEDSKLRQRLAELAALTNQQGEELTRATPKEVSHSATEGQSLRESIRILEGWLAAIRKP